MNPLRVAIIGCGKIADQHAEQIQRIRSGKLVATCDREILMARQLAERFRVESSYDSVPQLLKESQPEVVHITTPPQSHFELAMDCLSAGCHVYIEKPFSLDSRQARTMIDTAERYGRKLTVGHNVQFSPEMNRMRDMVESGILGGAPLHIESIFSYNLGDASYVRSMLSDPNHWVRALPGKLLQNVISHGIGKIAEFFETEDAEVSVTGFTSPQLRELGEREIVDELRVSLYDGRHTTAYFTFTTQVGPPVQELRVFGRHGTILVDNLHRTAIRLTKANSDFKSFLNFFIPPVKLAWQHGSNFKANVVAFLRSDFHMESGMKNLIERFYEAIHSDGAPPISHREILFTANVMDKIFAQLKECKSSDATVAVSPARHPAAIQGVGN